MFEQETTPPGGNKSNTAQPELPGIFVPSAEEAASDSSNTFQSFNETTTQATEEDTFYDRAEDFNLDIDITCWDWTN